MQEIEQSEWEEKEGTLLGFDALKRFTESPLFEARLLGKKKARARVIRQFPSLLQPCVLLKKTRVLS